VSDLVEVAARVTAAVALGRPVVALETTLVTHGLPRGEGIACAVELEEVVRGGGAEPATIGVLDGRVRVGLQRDELERLAAAPNVAKLSLSNLAAHVARGEAGSTTVAASIFAAARAGIRVFATGGIGGVHREAGASFDVSADLGALARFPVAVVCSGAKAVLDLPKTLEVLETLGVPVYGLGTDRFPAFYRRDSGLPVDARFDSVAALAEALLAQAALGLGTGVVVGSPVPAEHELPEHVYSSALDAALAESRSAGISGRDVTPFLLSRMEALSDGRSVFSNRGLLRRNAAVAAELAVALCDRG
jgi:pseudouridylate synthase